MDKFRISVIHVITLICIYIVLATQTEHEDDGESLKVEIIDKPPSCATSSQRGNLLKVHYTGYLLGGQTFDSRLVASRCLEL